LQQANRRFGGVPKVSKMTPSKFASGTGLQIPLKTPGFSFRPKCDRHFNFPRPVLRGVWAFPAIVFDKSHSQIARNTRCNASRDFPR